VFNFIFDRRNDSRPYPNLAPMMSNPHESYHGMGDDWPFIIPCRLLYYSYDHEFPCNISYLDQPIPDNAWYPVGLGFFHFEIDYFGMMSDQVLDLLRTNAMRVLFYYHEGDNPWHEKRRLDHLCEQHKLSVDCYRFVSGNTQADNVPGFVWFPDHELFYWRNAVRWNDRSMPGASYHNRVRGHRYTALNRLHKWWRATVMTELLNRELLVNSYWSYNNIDIGDLWTDNPIQLGQFSGLEEQVKSFVNRGAMSCDTLDPVQQNSHWTLVAEHFDDAYCHLVLETLYDAEQSGGAFLTEKTFKPIRHAQPFIIFGTVDSLATLRKLGYQTYDNFIDNAYDNEIDNTQRFKKTLTALEKVNAADLHEFYIGCRDQIIHNQELFLSSKHNRLAKLSEKLNRD
jgi:hypothetical protein